MIPKSRHPEGEQMVGSSRRCSGFPAIRGTGATALRRIGQFSRKRRSTGLSIPFELLEGVGVLTHTEA